MMSEGCQPGLTPSVCSSVHEALLNIMIPMGGSSEAFEWADTGRQSRLIKIVGRPLLLHVLDNLKLVAGRCCLARDARLDVPAV